MAIYSKNSNKKLTKSALKKTGITFVSVFGVLLINLIFNIFPFINSFFLGFLGLFTYAIFLFNIILGIFFICDKQISLNGKTLTLILVTLCLFVCLIHLFTTKKYVDYSYGEYLKTCYNSKVTAGGLLFGIFTYMVLFLTHYVGACITFVIAMVITTSFTIDRFITKKQTAIAKVSNAKDAIVSEPRFDLGKEDDEEEQNETEDYTESPAGKNNVDDDIFIKDDEPEEKRTAKKILGLRNYDDEDNIETESEPEEFASFRQKVKQGTNNKPNFIYHGDDSDLDETTVVKSNAVEDKKTTEDSAKKRRMTEFLSASKGKYTPLDSTPEPTNSKPIKSEPVKNDLYDDSFSLKSYEKNKDSYIKQNEEFDKRYANLKNDEDEFNSISLDDYVFGTPKAKETPNADTRPKREFYNQVSMDTNKSNGNTLEPKHEYGFENNNSFTKPLTSTNNNFLNNSDSNNSSFNKSEPKEEKKVFPKPRKYVYPTTDLLKYYPNNDGDSLEEQQQKGKMLEATLESFKIPAKISSIAKGPAFTRYELQMPIGIPVKRVLGFTDDIAMALESKGSIRTEIPIPGKNAFGVEVPNKKIATVSLRDVLESKNFTTSKSPLTFALGQDIANESKVSRLDKAPHMLVAGSTGSGKSVCLNSMLISWIFKASPDDVRLILIDPKQVEFTPYNKLPHLLIPNVITNTEKALNALSWCIDEMERRYSLFSKFGVRNIEEYNDTSEVKSQLAEHFYYIVVVVDELADLMSQSKKDFEEKIMRLTQKARAAGIHLVLATQRPSVDVITGTIKNNLPTRIAFAVSSFADSKTIIGESGAENLLGKGDMLFAPSDSPTPSRIQGCFISNDEIKAVLDFVKDNNDAIYDSEIEDKMFNRNQPEIGGFEAEPTAEVFDPLMKDALRNFIKTNNASVSKLQRIFNIGFNRAGRIVDQMEAAGFVSTKDSKNNRVIFITQQEFEERFGEDL